MSTMHLIPYADVHVKTDRVLVIATHEQLHEWRIDHCWPCSELARLEGIRVEFDRNGLCDLYAQNDRGADVDIPADEFNAWSTDVLRDVLPMEHPCYFVAVGQFQAA